MHPSSSTSITLVTSLPLPHGLKFKDASKVFQNVNDVIRASPEGVIKDILNIEPQGSERKLEALRFRIERSFDLLSVVIHSQSPNKGLLSSKLISFINEFALVNAQQSKIAFEVTQIERFHEDPDLQVLIKKIEYISKNWQQKYGYQLKKETKGISAALFFSGIGMIFAGAFAVNRSYTIEEESAAQNQRTLGWTQIAVGTSWVASPFLKAASRVYLK